MILDGFDTPQTAMDLSKNIYDALKKQHDTKYDELLSKLKETEKKAIKDYNEDSETSKEELSKMINSIREQYESDKESILKDRITDTGKLEKEHKKQDLPQKNHSKS